MSQRAYFEPMYAYLPSWAAEKEKTVELMFGAEHTSRVRQLYKLIFRVHRSLPAELRVLGDNYARDEFKRHKSCNPAEAHIFLKEWTEYAIGLAKQMKRVKKTSRSAVGKYLDPQMLEYMTDEQLAQLYELHRAASEPEQTKEKE